MSVVLENGILKFIMEAVGKTPAKVLKLCIDDIEAGYWLCGKWSCETKLNGFKHPQGCAMALVAMHSDANLGRYCVKPDDDQYWGDSDQFDHVPESVVVEWTEPDNYKVLADNEMVAKVVPYLYNAIPESYRLDIDGAYSGESEIIELPDDLTVPDMVCTIVNYNDGTMDSERAMAWFLVAHAAAKDDEYKLAVRPDGPETAE